MLKIRMQRIGKKGQAYFRLVVLEHTIRPKGKYLELLGSYDPHKNLFEAKADRVKHWMSQGAQLSATANNLLIRHKLIEGEQMTVWKAKKKEVEVQPASAPKPAPVPVTPKAEPISETPSEPAVEETPASAPKE